MVRVMTAETVDHLRAKLIGFLGRMVSVEEIRQAMNLKTSTYYDQVKENRLINYENLLNTARAFGLNEVALLVEMELLDADAAAEYAEGALTLRGAKQSRKDVPDL